MFQNCYADEVDRWKIDLIFSRAKRKGFRRHDLEDVQQQIVLQVATFRFNPEQANGATEATALTALIDRQLSTMRRAKRRYQNRLDRLKADPGAADEARENHDHLVVDVRHAVARLSPEERNVCVALGEGRSVAEIATNLGCGWHTIRRRMLRIRRRFQKIGLEEWLRD